MRLAATVAAAAAAVALPGTASAAPSWVEGPTYGDFVTGFDLAVTPDGGVTAVWNNAEGGGFTQRTPAGGGPSAPPLALGGEQGPAYAGPVAASAGDSVLAAYLQLDENGKTAVRVATVTADGAVGPGITVIDGIDGLISPQLAFAGDGEGGALVGWVSESPNGPRAFVRRLHADGTLGPRVQLGAADNTARLTVALLPDGTARVLWLEYGSWELMAARLTADGALDGAPQLISTDDMLEALEPVLDVGATGAVAAWQEPGDHSWETKQVKIARLSSAGAVADAPEHVATVGDSDNEGVAVALADDGAATVAWSETYADQRAVGVLRFRRVAADGTLGPVALLTEPAQEDGIDALPRLVETGGGALHAVWGRWTDDGNIAPHARAIAADGTLGPQRELAPVGIPGGNGLPYPAGAAADGTVTVGWGRPIPGGDGTTIVATATLDTAPPRIEAEIPATVAAGAPVRFRAVGVDPSGIASVRWEFGDGSGADGAEITRAYAHAGSYEASVTVTDRAGNLAVARQVVTVTPAADRVPGPPDPPPGGGDQPPAPPTGDTRARSQPRAAAALRFAAIRRSGARVQVRGTIARRTRGAVTVTWRQRSGRRTIRRSARGRIVRGRFTATLRLPAALVTARTRATVTLTWRGDARTRPATAIKRVAIGGR
jgi:hypothetical protein